MSAGYLSLLAGDPQRGVADMEAGREILLEVGEDDYWSLSGLAMAEAEVGHRIRAAELWRQAAEVAKQDGNLSRQATCAGNLAGNAVEMGEYDEALELAFECLRLVEAANASPSHFAWAHQTIAEAAFLSGRTDLAWRNVDEAVRRSRDAADSMLIFLGVALVSGMCAAAREASPAATLAGAAEELAAQMDLKPSPMNQRLAQETLQRVQALIGSDKATQHMADGRSMSEEDAVALALRQTEAHLTPR